MPPLQLVGVEGMQRLADFEHHEIRDVDDVVDRTQPDGFQFRAQPVRARPDLDVLDAARGIERALSRSARSILTLGRRRSVCRRSGDLRRRSALPGQSRDLAGQTVMAQQVAAVRRDLDVENRVGGKKLAIGAPILRFRRKNQQAVAVLATIRVRSGCRAFPAIRRRAVCSTLIFRPFGNTAPGSASGTLSPTL